MKLLRLFRNYLFFLILLGVTSVQADNINLKIGIYNFQPLVFMDDKGQAKGLFVDILDGIAEKENWNISYIAGTWDECLTRLSSGEIDILACISFSDEREKKFDFTQKDVFVLWAELYQRKNLDIETILDLKDKRISVVKGANSNKELETLLDKFSVSSRITEFNGYPEVLTSLKSAQSDVGLFPNTYAPKLLKSQDLERTNILFAPTRIRFAVKKQTQQNVLKTLDHYFSVFMADHNSIYYKYYHKWIGLESELKVPKWVWWAIGLFMGSFLVLALFNFFLKRQVKIKTSELMQTIKQLGESEIRLRQAQQMAQTGYWDWDFTTGELFWSDDVYRIFGQKKDLFHPTAEAFEACIHPEDYSSFVTKRDAALSEGKPVNIDHRIVLPDGSVRYVQELSEIIKENGRMVRVSGSVQDITERKKTEEALVVSEKRFKLAMDASRDGLFDWNLKTNEIYYSPAWKRMLGYEDSDLPNDLSIWESLTAPEDVKRTWKMQNDLINKKRNRFEIEFKMKHKEGHWIDVLSRATATFDENETAVRIVGTHLDITERKKNEIEIKGSKELFETVFNSQQDSLFILSADAPAKIKKCNKAVKNMFGYSVDELMDETIERLHVNADHLKKFQKVLFPSIDKEGLLKNFQFTMKRKDGKVFPSEHTVLELKNDNGERAGWLSIIRDITEKKEMEERIIQAQKIESIGNLAGGIAHDFNNILFPIVGMSELLLEDLPPHSLQHDNAREILMAGKRGSDLVKQILAFSRQSEHKLIPVRARQIVQEVLKLTRATIPSYIDIEEDIQPDCGLLMADPTQIHQVAMNIITNAFHAVERKGGKITVQLREVDRKADAPADSCLCAGRCIRLSIADTGHGIPPELMNKIFEPYFTTKEQGKGTGLGLAVAYGIIKEHKGDITVSSAAGKGTTFHVYLPLMEKTVETAPAVRAETDPKGSERILLTDDEASIAKLEKLMLERLGYQVTSRTGSMDALETFRSRPDAFDLVITDMTMPDMTGDQLARELKRIRPDIPIMICTGFSERMDREAASQIGVTGFLMKPIIKSELARMVRKVLDEAGR